jgi:hypothetical protein
VRNLTRTSFAILPICPGHRLSSIGKSGTVCLLLTLATLAGPAYSQGARGCALFVENSAVCLATANGAQCVPLNKKRNGEHREFKCLVESSDLLSSCFSVSIAPNTVVVLRPFKVVYHLMLYPKLSDQDLFEQPMIASTCRTQAGREEWPRQP